MNPKEKEKVIEEANITDLFSINKNDESVDDIPQDEAQGSLKKTEVSFKEYLSQHDLLDEDDDE